MSTDAKIAMVLVALVLMLLPILQELVQPMRTHKRPPPDTVAPDKRIRSGEDDEDAV